MKSFLRGLLVILSFVIACVIYNWIFGSIWVIADGIISKVPFLNWLFGGWFKPFMDYTVLPITIAYGIVCTINIIFKKIGIISYTIIMLIVGVTTILYVLICISQYGLLSWAVLDVIWYFFLLDGIIGYCLFSLTGYELKKAEDK